MEPKPIVELHKVLGILLMNSYDFQIFQATTICRLSSLSYYRI